MIAGGDEGESKRRGRREGRSRGGRRRRGEARHCRRRKSRSVAVSLVFWFLAWLLAGRPCTYACMPSCPHVRICYDAFSMSEGALCSYTCLQLGFFFLICIATVYTTTTIIIVGASFFRSGTKANLLLHIERDYYSNPSVSENAFLEALRWWMGDGMTRPYNSLT
jgi:hypothetical protein